MIIIIIIAKSQKPTNLLLKIVFFVHRLVRHLQYQLLQDRHTRCDQLLPAQVSGLKKEGGRVIHPEKR